MTEAEEQESERILAGMCGEWEGDMNGCHPSPTDASGIGHYVYPEPAPDKCDECGAPVKKCPCCGKGHYEEPGFINPFVDPWPQGWPTLQDPLYPYPPWPSWAPPDGTPAVPYRGPWVMYHWTSGGNT